MSLRNSSRSFRFSSVLYYSLRFARSAIFSSARSFRKFKEFTVFSALSNVFCRIPTSVKSQIAPFWPYSRCWRLSSSSASTKRAGSVTTMHSLLEMFVDMAYTSLVACVPHGICSTEYETALPSPFFIINNVLLYLVHYTTKRHGLVRVLRKLAQKMEYKVVSLAGAEYTFASY